MKKLLITLLIMFVSPAFMISAQADNIYTDTARQFGADKLYDILSEEEKDIAGEPSFDGNIDVGGALSRLWKSFIEKLVLQLKDNIEYFTALIAISLTSTISSTICASKKISFFIELAGCCSACVLSLGNVDSITSQTLDAMYRLSDYSKAALPVIFTASAASGAVSSSAAKFAAVSFALDVLMSISQSLIIPVIYAFLALTVSNCMFPNPLLTGVQRLCKWTAGILMSGMTLAFTAYMSMVGAIGSAVDTTAVKAARSFISGVLPVVGGMISDASAMVLSAAGVVKSSAGVFGLITVCVMCAGPFALLSVKAVLLKGVAALAESMDNRSLSTLFSGLGSAMALLLGLLGSCGIMLFVSLTAGMKAVNL